MALSEPIARWKRREVLTTEPVRLTNHLLTMVRLGLGLLVSMGVFNLTEGQLELAVGFAVAFFAAIEVMATEWARRQVAPLQKFTPKVRKAIKKGKEREVRPPRKPLVAEPIVTPPLDHYQEP